MSMLHTQHERALDIAANKPSVAAFFSYGFRPFFLGAAVFGATLMAVWILFVTSQSELGWPNWLPVEGAPYAWHGHEMVFGFAAAAIAGFLLTAVPNWTGALPLSGPPLVALFALWLAGRLAMGFSARLPFALVAATDLAFLPSLGAFAAQQLLVKPAARNLIFLALLAILTLVNLTFHLATQQIIDIDAILAVRFSLLVVAIFIAIIGGRIIPAFTHNWLNINAKGSPMPQRVAWLDGASILSIAAYAVTTLSGTHAGVEGAVALVAALLNAARLVLWRGWTTFREPIVWILHLGYLWLVVGLALGAAAALTNLVPASLASHAFGAGAVGTTMMAVMSRASLGHTGRPLVAPRPIVLSYLLVNMAAAVRVLGPILAPGHVVAVLTTAALAWIVAFGVFTVVYAPILTTERVHLKVKAARPT